MIIWSEYSLCGYKILFRVETDDFRGIEMTQKIWIFRESTFSVPYPASNNNHSQKMMDQKVKYLVNEKLEFVRRPQFESHLGIDEMDRFFEFEHPAFWLVYRWCLLIGRLILFHFDCKKSQHGNNSKAVTSMISKNHKYWGLKLDRNRQTLTSVDFVGSNSLKTFKTNSPWLVIPKTPLMGQPPSSTRLGQ